MRASRLRMPAVLRPRAAHRERAEAPRRAESVLLEVRERQVAEQPQQAEQSPRAAKQLEAPLLREAKQLEAPLLREAKQLEAPLLREARQQAERPLGAPVLPPEVPRFHGSSVTSRRATPSIRRVSSTPSTGTRSRQKTRASGGPCNPLPRAR